MTKPRANTRSIGSWDIGRRMEKNITIFIGKDTPRKTTRGNRKKILTKPHYGIGEVKVRQNGERTSRKAREHHGSERQTDHTRRQTDHAYAANESLFAIFTSTNSLGIIVAGLEWEPLVGKRGESRC